MSTAIPSWLTALAGDFDSAGVTWAFRRGPELTARAVTRGPDLDMWCRTRDATLVADILHARGWRVQSGRAVGGVRSRRYSPMLQFRSLEPASRMLLELAIGALRWRAFVGLEEDDVARTITRTNGLPYLRGVAELSITSTRVVIRGQLAGDRLTRARALWDTADEQAREQWRRATAALLGTRMTTEIEGWLESRKEPLPRHGWRATLLALRHQPAALLAVARHAPRKVREGIGRNSGDRGIVIAVVGTDGSGKSTMARRVANRLKDRGLEADQVYLGRSRENTRVVTAIRQVVIGWLENRRSSSPDDSAGSDPVNAVSPADAPPNVLWRLAMLVAAPVYLVEYWIRFLQRVRPSIRKGIHVLLDRGPDDLALMPGPTWLMMALARLGPPRHLTVLCDAPPEVILSRKQERSFEAVVRHQATYAAITESRAQQGRSLKVATVESGDEGVDAVERAVYAVSAVRTHRLDADLLPWLVRPISWQPRRGAHQDP